MLILKNYMNAKKMCEKKSTQILKKSKIKIFVAKIQVSPLKSAVIGFDLKRGKWQVIRQKNNFFNDFSQSLTQVNRELLFGLLHKIRELH